MGMLKGMRQAGLFLILIAVAGKLALLNLKGARPLELVERGSLVPAAAAAVGGDEGGGWRWKRSKGEKLRDTLRALQAEKGELEGKIESVELKQERKAREAAAKKEAAVEHEEKLSSLSSELSQQARQRDTMLSQLTQLRGKGTRQDEELVGLLERAEADKKKLKRVEVKLMAHKEEEGVRRSTLANIAAERELRSKGIGGGSMAGGAMATSEELERVGEAEKKADEAAESNVGLEESNKALEKKIAWEEAALQRKNQLYGSKALAAAGVVASSWGPVTADVSTRPDPRDSFAVKDEKAAKVAQAALRPATHSRASAASSSSSSSSATAGGAQMSEAQLEKDLGFKASILDSKSFAKSW